MLDFILQVMYLMLPAYLANLTPVLVKKLKFLDIPVDFNAQLGGYPVFGSHKTWRGVFFGTIAGIIAAYIQYNLLAFEFFSSLSLLDYSEWVTAGFLLGFGALLGDLVKSFFKRRIGIKPGARFIPWDQIDYTLGSLLLILPLFTPSPQFVATALVLNFCMHVAANHLAFYLGISRVKW